MQLKSRTSVLLALMGMIFTPFAQAHIVTTETIGLLSGVVHPLTGADHMLAAFAAGILAAVSGGSRARSVIAAFLGMLGLGAIAGFAGASLGLVEPVIALSVITLGVLIALRVSLPRLVAPAVAGGFVLFHGYAHAAGLPLMAGSAWYLLGLLMATSFLLGSGVALGRWLEKSESQIPMSLAGGFVALIGSLLLASA
ncbi:MAG: HupE/UreJ family protein [Gammaproteobacteria bacterium]